MVPKIAPPGAVALMMRPQLKSTGTGNDPEVDGFAGGQGLVVVAPDVTDRREAGPDNGPGRGRHHEVAELLGSGRLAMPAAVEAKPRAPVEVGCEMAMGVDQARA